MPVQLITLHLREKETWRARLREREKLVEVELDKKREGKMLDVQD